MLRSLLRASAAFAFALLLASPQLPSAAPAPGIAYDEIVRVVVNASPPPPGNFQADLASVNAPQAGATPTPAPRRRGFGNLVNIATGVITGNNAGAIASSVAVDALSVALENAMQQSISAQFSGIADAARSFLQPHLMHYAYWNGWERVDDVSAQTATIRKCDLGQVVQLDLAHKTYSVYTPGAEPQPTYAPRAPTRGSTAPSTPAPPGTAVADLSETTRSLGSTQLENQPTVGYDATTAFTISHSTGSCRDGGAAIRTLEYYSALPRPTVNSCPIRRAPIPENASEAVTMPSASGGCRPTFTFHRIGPTPPSTRLSLYSLVTLSGTRGGPTPAPGASPSPGLGFLTERGNLKTLGSSDNALFEIPQGFTKTP